MKEKLLTKMRTRDHLNFKGDSLHFRLILVVFIKKFIRTGVMHGRSITILLTEVSTGI